MRSWLTAAAAAAATATALAASAPAWAGAAADANAFNESFDRVSGKFSQTIAGDKKTRKSSGTFRILRPGYFKWVYETPYSQIIVGNKSGVYLYDVDLSQVTRRSFGEAVGGNPSAILADKDALKKHYDLQDGADEDGLSWALAKPKDKDAEFRDVRLGFEKGKIKRMRLVDEYGNRIEVDFSDLDFDSPLKPKDFDFEIPKGVDVFDDGAGGK